ncbi:DEAD/DEAH box helicase family protein [Mycoplasmopsis agassizii]|uniref:Type III restriction enzyme, res subunit n=1 Tax=Mycoplasmopsis agassizii TaxID=33922 RepID=A0ABX4H547_9BACT|nr:DEAD/DEAH box helicase family protein [Mycoplasmopsis agassizii]PAF54983.1 hypothetical protein CJF60_04595 [Mycoplasmopsis agassizii]SMC17649.1 Type III restriction enzyme, res subunit [Mycoplasmopsis agassizii]
MATKKIKNDFPFYQALLEFYKDNKNSIKRSFKSVSRKILDYNDKSKNENAYLRKPQFEAFEIYVFIKEYLSNQKVKEIFNDWYHQKEKFELRNVFARSNKEYQTDWKQSSIVDDITSDIYGEVFDRLNSESRDYPNYIYALTMGTGKTILIATCIFYDFVVSSKFPKDDRFCHNALVFAPDKTVLQSLKEIQTFDLNKVMPTEYASFLTTNVKFHFMNDTSTTLNTIDGSDYNIIISNTQKIILKQIHKQRSAMDKFINEEYNYSDDYESLMETFKDEKVVAANQRYEKIIRLKQLGVFVDEAHHLFGADLKNDLSEDSKETSLRYTINEISLKLQKKGTKLVACYNYTGTPYVENKILPEVVYAYELSEAIRNKYLKDIEIQGYENVKNKEFLRKVLIDFFNYHGDNLYEGLMPKIAIFGADIKEIIEEIKPVVETILVELGKDISTILVNVGDSSITKDQDINNFNNLDQVGTEGSKKQVLLLVNKGREGWNCRSLFSVALFRSPKSKIFVLQSTMRCLRSITNIQQIAHVYLSEENYKILDNELKKNFNVDIKSITEKKIRNSEYIVSIVPPVKNITLTEIKKSYTLNRNNISKPFYFDVSRIDTEKYKSKLLVKKGIDKRYVLSKTEFISNENIVHSKYSIVFEISRYLNENPILINKMLQETKTFDDILNYVSMYNDILYDELIPSIFSYLYFLKEETETKLKTVPLIKYKKGTKHFIFNSPKNLTIEKNDSFVKSKSEKSFHVNRYCFDSIPEKKLFMDLLESKHVKEVYFTGMFTGSENGLSVQYIDPDSNLIRTYYPDILVYYYDGSIEIIEVKGDNKIDNRNVRAKAIAALNLASFSKMNYKIYKSSDIMKNKIKVN